jgi:Ribonucleotide reductase alpha domain
VLEQRRRLAPELRDAANSGRSNRHNGSSGGGARSSGASPGAEFESALHQHQPQLRTERPTDATPPHPPLGSHDMRPDVTPWLPSYDQGLHPGLEPQQDCAFALDAAFVQHWAAQEPPFGFNGLGELVYRRTYSRYLDEAAGIKEEWYQTVERVVNGTFRSVANRRTILT